MKKLSLFLVLLFAAGCAGKGADVASYFKDPQYVTYTEQKDMLEKKYVNKEITYATYVEELNDLEMDYQRNTQKIEKKISD